MNDDPFLKLLGETVREEGRAQASWERLAEGTTSAEESAELERAALADPAARELYETYKPLDDDAFARFERTARAAMAAGAGGGAPAGLPTMKARTAVVSPVVSPLRPRKVMLYPLAIAAAFLLIAGTVARHYLGDGSPEVVATVDLIPAMRGAEKVAEVTLPLDDTSGTKGVVRARLSLPAGVATGRTYVAQVSSTEGEPTYRSPPLRLDREGELEVQIPVSSLTSSTATIAVSPEDHADELAAFFEVRVHRAQKAGR